MAITSSGQKSVTVAKPRPVAAMSSVAAINRLRCGNRYACMPTKSVSSPDPNSVAVAMMPT